VGTCRAGSMRYKLADKTPPSTPGPPGSASIASTDRAGNQPGTTGSADAPVPPSAAQAQPPAQGQPAAPAQTGFSARPGTQQPAQKTTPSGPPAQGGQPGGAPAQGAQPPAAGQQPPASNVPAGAEESPRKPGFRQRGRMRRRLRYLRSARELSYRDLGGLTFDLHRFGGRREELTRAKLDRLAHIDAELRALERVLEDRQSVTVLRQAGVVACPRCAEIHSGEDRFCPQCGMPVSPDAERPLTTAPAPSQTRPAPGVPTAAGPVPGSAPAPAPTPQSAPPGRVSMPVSPASPAGQPTPVPAQPASRPARPFRAPQPPSASPPPPAPAVPSQPASPTSPTPPAPLTPPTPPAPPSPPTPTPAASPPPAATASEPATQSFRAVTGEDGATEDRSQTGKDAPAKADETTQILRHPDRSTAE